MKEGQWRLRRRGCAAGCVSPPSGRDSEGVAVLQAVLQVVLQAMLQAVRLLPLAGVPSLAPHTSDVNSQYGHLIYLLCL